MSTDTQRGAPFTLFPLQSAGIRRIFKDYPKQAPSLFGQPVRRGKKPFHKTAGVAELLGMTFNMKGGLNAILFHQMVSEVIWDRDGRPVVFPPNEAFYEQLLTSRYGIDGDAVLSLPHRCFILAMPRGFTYEGVAIPSPIVMYTRDGNERKALTAWALKAMGSTDSVEAPENPVDAAQPKLIFFFRNPYDGDNDTCSICSLTGTQIAQVLKAETPEAFENIVGRYDEAAINNAPLASETNFSDVVMQWVITRLIAGLSVYLSARGDTALTDGLPTPDVEVDGVDFRTRPRYLTVPQATANEPSGEIGLTTRRWFFRNLRADCYYRGEHKDAVPGSRWTFVRPTTVGRYKAQTINEAGE